MLYSRENQESDSQLTSGAMSLEASLPWMHEANEEIPQRQLCIAHACMVNLFKARLLYEQLSVAMIPLK